MEKKNGFTLLEIIVVLSLITLILGLSAVFLTGFLPASRMDATARELAGTIRQARSLARLNSERRTIMIDLDSMTYSMEGQGQKAFPPDIRVSVIDSAAGEIVHGKYPIVFNRSGGIEGGTIFLSRGKKVIRIELDPITGALLLR
jgi:prepilin-type N-terminal cleavage/methylation domain-containing protein